MLNNGRNGVLQQGRPYNRHTHWPKIKLVRYTKYEIKKGTQSTIYMT